MVGGRSLGGRAKHIDSLANRTNISGGVKKPGLPSTVGLDAAVAGVYRKKVGCPCPFVLSTTRTCGISIGGGIVKPRC